MKKILTAFIVTVFIIGCQAQPKSDYKLPWTAEINSVKYLVFVEERATSTGFTLQPGMDYKLGAAAYLIDSVDAPLTQLIRNYSNDGKYIVFGVVGVNSDGLYGAMGVSQPYKKPTVPSQIITLPILRIP